MKKINHITNKRIVIYVKKEFKTDDNDKKKYYKVRDYSHYKANVEALLIISII